MIKPSNMNLNPLESIRTTVLTTSRDLLSDKDMAWLYLILSPDIFNSEVFDEYLDRFGWNKDKERLIQLNKNFQLLLSIYPHNFIQAVQALRDISNPIAKMKRELEYDELNGFYAVKLSEDHEYLKSIANSALKSIESSSK